MTRKNLQRAGALLLCLAMLFGASFVPGAEQTVVSAAGFSVPGKCPFVLDGDYLKGVELNTTAGELMYYWRDAVIADSTGKALGLSDKVGTGTTVTVNGSTVTVIVSGDVDGDGVSSDADTAVAKLLLTNAQTSGKFDLIAAELNGDGVISTADYLRLKHAESCGLLVQSASSTVKVPDLSGKTVAEAKTALESVGLVADVRYTTAGSADEDQKVMYQKTAPGTLAGEGASICFTASTGGKYVPLNYDSMKGLWLYQYTSSTSLFKQGTSQRDEASYRQLVERIADNMSKDGFNTVFLQMRPYGDALYPDSVYPPSPYATSMGGLNYSGTFKYDPLEVFIEVAHEKGISVHAWLNPMRLMTTGSIATVPTTYKIGEWYNDSSKNGDYIVSYGGRYYLNPAYQETRQLVVDGCMEICKNYDIDGIHFDDYFYISIDGTSADLAFDQKSFDKLGGSLYGSSNNLEVRKRWRRNNVNMLLKEIFSAMKEYDDRILFGISPAGNIDNNQTGYLCADVRTWCSQPGYIDYIAPQVYWSFSWKSSGGATYAAFDKCCESWSKLVTCKDVRLIIGMGIYRADKPSYSSTDPDWYNKRDNIKRMLEYTKKMEKCTGWIMFKYENVYNILSSGYYTGMKEELDNFLPLVAEW